MTHPTSDSTRPDAGSGQPGQPGDAASTADGSVSNALERSTERGDDAGFATPGDALNGGQAPRTDPGDEPEPGTGEATRS